MFFITGLPRSRTAWFSAFMTASGYPCLHEGINGCSSIAEYKSKIKEVSDSNTALGFIDLDIDRPTLVIHRDKRLGNEYDRARNKLKAINGLHVDFYDIDKRIAEIFKYLTGDDINKSLYDTFKYLNITTMIDIDSDSAMRLLNEPNK